MMQGGRFLICSILFQVLIHTGCGEKSELFQTVPLVDESGKSVFERFPAPEGYQKIKSTPGSWRDFLQEFPLFMYAGTISLHRDLSPVDRNSEYQIGEVLVHPGSPGHAVMIVDKAKNNKGEVIYLLAQGYTQAQSFHIVKSGNSGISPWFEIPKPGPVWHKRFYLS